MDRELLIVEREGDPVEGTAPYSDATRILLTGVVNSGIHETVPVPPLNLYPYALRVEEITNYYAVGEPSTLNDRLRKRNAEIRHLFVSFASKRGGELGEHRSFQVVQTRCHNNHPGTRKLCNGEMSWGAAYNVIPESVADSESSFHERARIGRPDQIVWVMRKTGKGSNHGSVQGTARFTVTKIEAEIEVAKSALRAELIARGLPTDEVIDP